jgi:mRNA-degrading endonuclease toxin of MazEF toxin-antitoxin module
MNLLRGDVWYVDPDPTKGAEINKKRPCVIFSSSAVNRRRQTVVVVPLSSSPTVRPPLTIAVTVNVAKGTISPQSWQQACNMATVGFTPTNEYVLGRVGEQLSEVSLDENGVMSWQHTNVYAAGTLMATYDPNGLHFLLNDWLGTRRAQTTEDAKK